MDFDLCKFDMPIFPVVAGQHYIVPFDSELSNWVISFFDCEPFPCKLQFIGSDESEPGFDFERGVFVAGGSKLNAYFPDGQRGDVRITVRLEKRKV